MIEPTVGRIVWFTPSPNLGDSGFIHHDRTQPLAAIVTHVWGPRMVNLAVFDSDGNRHSRTSVTLLQDDDLKPEFGYFASWMPYQKGQAAKTEQLEKVAGNGAYVGLSR